MNTAGTSDELDRSRQALVVAYERARAAGYRPGSRAMQALHRAEQDYQHAQTKRKHDSPSPDTYQNPDDGDGEAGQANHVIDLRQQP